MASQIFVNLPVKDLTRSINFFTRLGFTFNAQYTNDKATCMIIGENIFAMLLTIEFFKTFTIKDIADAANSTEVILAISLESRERVDEIVTKALEAGGKASSEKQDHGWMYVHGFEDPDGHLWEVMYIDPSGLVQV